VQLEVEQKVESAVIFGVVLIDEPTSLSQPQIANLGEIVSIRSRQHLALDRQVVRALSRRQDR
jgi:Lon protease-like protein